MVNIRISEIIGAIIGDGNIRYKPEIYQYYFEIVCSPDERKYLEYLSKLIYEEFGKRPRIFIGGRGLRLRLNSKEIVNLLINEYSIPFNKGKGLKVKIPNSFIDNKKLLYLCLRGIMDTDGTFFL